MYVVALVRRLNDVYYRKAYDGTFESSTLACQGQYEELTAWGKALSTAMPVCMVQSVAQQHSSLLPGRVAAQGPV